MLVTDLINVRYLSGFTGSNGALLVFADDREPVLATDGRYRTQAAAQAPGLEVVIERACGRSLAGRAADDGVRRLGFESHVVTVDGFDAHKDAIKDASTTIRQGPPSWCAPPEPWRRCARSKTPASWRCCGWPARRPTLRWGSAGAWRAAARANRA